MVFRALSSVFSARMEKIRPNTYFWTVTLQREPLKFYISTMEFALFYKYFVRLYLEHWFQSYSADSTVLFLPLFIFWTIWKLRNGCIFEDKQSSIYAILLQTEALLHLYPVPKKMEKIRNTGMPPQIFYPCGFFNGSAAGNIGGSGFVIHLSCSHCLYFSLGCGSSTNTRSKLLALWALLSVTTYGDPITLYIW